MSPSTSIQSRISAFESLKDQRPHKTNPKIINDFGELADDADAPSDAPNILEEPISPIAHAFSTIAPSSTPSPMNRVHSLSGSDLHSPSRSPPSLGRKSSLLDLNDWVVDVEGPNVSSTGTGPIGAAPHRWLAPPAPGSSLSTRPLPPPRKGMPERPTSTRSPPSTTTPLIQLDEVTPQKSKSGPPIPPKKVPASKLTNSPNVRPAHLASSISISPKPPTLSLPRRTDSLTVEPQHIYPPSLKLDIVPNGRGRHAPASSVSSFHSVSLSDGGDTGTPSSLTHFVFTYPMDRNVTGNTSGSGNNGSVHGGGDDSCSLDESFENVSTISDSHSYDFAYGSLPPTKPQIPPRLPERRNKPQTGASAIATSKTQATISSPPQSPVPPLARMPSTSSTTSNRRMPPPPPPNRNSSSIPRTTASSRASPPSTSASDRSSILSTATTGTSYTSGSSHTPTINSTIFGNSGSSINKFSRQPPIPASARHRYEKVFYINVEARKRARLETSQKQIPGLLGVPGMGSSSPTSVKKARKAAGWRGLSVDLITNPAENLPSHSPSHPGSRRGSMESADSGGVTERGKDDRLEGVVVKRIWMCSNLDREKLRMIWNDCEGSDTGSLEVDAFVKAMWRIDEELRKARLNPSSFSPNSGNGSISRRQPRRIGSILR
ncbi:hypothetical protein BJ322DRAFT_18328 [Thelephora terrestris]|uniref:EH domain-containing protein n=1 Tax=Thelephora terrestris TaxID=56493 RepID=A0A9P6LCC7_9AGAM|nr:hypothetical protein BJ322DRAFT_18328 [Thelephora terrestris]